MKKILLIDPPGFEGNSIGRILGSFGTNKANQMWPPYDLQIMAGYCLKNGHDVKIIDANNLGLTYGRIKKEIVDYKPDWVIYLTCFPTFILDAEVAKASKEINPEIKTACMSLSIRSVQGPAEKMLRLPYLDFIPWGEAEIPLMKLINGANPETVNSLYYRDKDSSIKFTGGTPSITDLNELGTPVHKGLPLNIYTCPVSIRKPMTIVNCSRGCINSCVHCQAGTFQSPVRYRSLENTLEELSEIKSLGIREIKFYDCSLPTKREFTFQLCEAMINKGFNFSWNCNSRAEMLDDKILPMMKKAGCHTIAIGCESSDNKILRNMRKNETSEQIEKAVRLVKANGMRVLMYLTFGLEGETAETMKQTYEFAKKLKPEFVTFGIVVPAPGTPFHESLAKQGLLIDKDLKWQDPNALPSFSYAHLPSNDLLGFTRKAYRSYYFSPAYIIHRLSNIRSFYELMNGGKYALSIIYRYFFERTR
jgi:anaerobic magnesium-protoporphyrin IX monomethyl ester cyclase